jgi:hypothetical protein
MACATAWRCPSFSICPLSIAFDHGECNQCRFTTASARREFDQCHDSRQSLAEADIPAFLADLHDANA